MKEKGFKKLKSLFSKLSGQALSHQAKRPNWILLVRETLLSVDSGKLDRFNDYIKYIIMSHSIGNIFHSPPVRMKNILISRCNRNIAVHRFR